MKRYDLEDTGVPGEPALMMIENPQGEWVKYEAVENLIEKNKCKDVNFFDQPRESQQEYKHG